jgi:hypothetical protein
MIAKSLTVAATILLFSGVTDAAYAQKAGGDNVGKCRAAVRKQIPDPAAPQNKRLAQTLFRKCMANGGKL